jgi:hypothetical protein
VLVKGPVGWELLASHRYRPSQLDHELDVASDKMDGGLRVQWGQVERAQFELMEPEEMKEVSGRFRTLLFEVFGIQEGRRKWLLED